MSTLKYSESLRPKSIKVGDQMDQHQRQTGQPQAGRLRSERPLSPHLQVYKPMLTMVMSILHRLTGVGLYFGALLFTWWLMAAASGPLYYEFVTAMFASLPGKLFLLLALWGFFHHLLGGVRHFIWDFGKGFDLPDVEFMARLSLLGSLGLTALVWFYL